MYIFVLLFCSLYLYILDKGRFKYNILSLLPCFMIYYLVPSLQYEVGTDYHNYINIYNTPHLLERFYTSYEYIFYFTVQLFNYLNLPEQSLFAFFSLIQSVAFFIYISKLKSSSNIFGWLLFFIFISTTGIYNNQMSGIRQYAALMLFPLITYYAFNGKYILSSLLIVSAILFHQTAIIFIIVYPLIFLFKKINTKYIIIFLCTIPIYYFGTNLVLLVVESLGLKYISYFSSDYAEPQDILSLFTRLYYLPLIFLFFMNYNQDNEQKNYYSFCIFLFCIFYFSFIMSFQFGLFFRISSYFWFFLIFPIYDVIKKYICRGDTLISFILIIYTCAPYFLKTIVFAKGEYLYSSIIFN
ncbi:MAG: EpsG family protein [Providencia sp.]|uniref:EpsG family protein n=1 Tax=Providencia sp. TaxID=589 RepID=UPI003F9E8570